MSEGKVIAVVNMKGGVGKTTTVVSICETLAAKGNRILVVDVDAQANASYCLAGDQLLKELIATERTVDAFFEDELIDNRRVRIQDIICGQVSKVTHRGQNLDISLLASSPNLRLTERDIICSLTERRFSLNGIEGKTKELFNRHLDELRETYSYIVFDCAPGISALTTAAVALADLIIVPTQPDFLSHLGLTAFITRVLREIRSNENRAVEKPHVLITRMKNTTLHDKYCNRIREEAALPDAPLKLFDTVISEAAAWQIALMINEGLFSHKYPLHLRNILAKLADEIDGAFCDDRN